MFHITCNHCGQQQLATNTQIQSVHHTSEGMVGYVKCACGTTVLHHFAQAYPKPKPPVSVLAVRAEQTAERNGRTACTAA